MIQKVKQLLTPNTTERVLYNENISVLQVIGLCMLIIYIFHEIYKTTIEIYFLFTELDTEGEINEFAKKNYIDDMDNAIDKYFDMIQQSKKLDENTLMEIGAKFPASKQKKYQESIETYKKYPYIFTEINGYLKRNNKRQFDGHDVMWLRVNMIFYVLDIIMEILAFFVVCFWLFGFYLKFWLFFPVLLPSLIKSFVLRELVYQGHYFKLVMTEFVKRSKLLKSACDLLLGLIVIFIVVRYKFIIPYEYKDNKS